MASLALSVCRIIELDMSDRSVGAVMSSLWHQQKLWLTDGFRCYCSVLHHGKMEGGRDGVWLFVPHVAEVESQTETYM